MDYDFVLMPSRFLETFGLSALDFAQYGVATIGYKKGGLDQFILDETDITRPSLNISNYDGETEQEQFDNAMSQIIQKYIEFKNNQSSVANPFFLDKDKIKENYSKEKRLQRFEEIVL